uniref:GRB10 interacting GYF protein 2 n=1 Tax=Iconisemion striatum TaxID=60296 RepID=A0A1A7XK63_9TELE
MQVCDELECLEETLLKRRAELRESDRLLLEAERLRDTTGGQVDIMLLRRLTSASSLLEAAQHLRELRRREEEELTLWEVKKAMRSRHQKFEHLNTKIKVAENRLAGVLSDCREARRHLESLTCQEEHKEQRLTRMKKEHRAALGQVEELREEEQKLQSVIKDLLEQQEALWIKRRSTVSNVRSEEQKLVTVKAELRSHRAELKRVLQENLTEQLVQEDEAKKISKERSWMQEQVDRKREELAALQQGVESGLKDVKQLRVELQEVQEQLSRRTTKRSNLQEQCKHLETRQRRADRRWSEIQEPISSQRGNSQLIRGVISTGICCCLQTFWEYRDLDDGQDAVSGGDLQVPELSPGPSEDPTVDRMVPSWTRTQQS